jgi:hypothetical protein
VVVIGLVLEFTVIASKAKQSFPYEIEIAFTPPSFWLGNDVNLFSHKFPFFYSKSKCTVIPFAF